MKPRILVLITVTITLAALAIPDRLQVHGQSQRQLQYTVTDLGTLGGTFSWTEGINDKGSVAGFSALPGDMDEHAFLWRKGVMTDLSTLGDPNSGLGFYGQDPNERGMVVGAAQTSTPDPLGEDFCQAFNNFGTENSAPLTCLPFVWQDGVLTPLPTLGGNNGEATEINSAGVVAGAAENTTRDQNCGGNPPRPKPVLWEKGVIQELPTFPGDPYGVVDAINDKGQAVGVSVIDCTGSAAHALLWQNGRLTDLGNLGGNSFDEGVDINNQGQVAGFSSLAGDTTFHSFLWTEDNGIQDLGTLPGDVSSYASGINNKGQVVGASNDATGNSRGFLWKNGVMTDLNTLIPPSSPLYLLVASQINSRGEIVGLALQTSTGQAHGFLATPCDEEYVDKGGCEGRAERTSAAQGEPKATLSEKVSTLLRQRLGHWSRPKLAPVGPTD